MVAKRSAAKVAAVAAGERQFIPEEPCGRGHFGPRYTSNGNCAACKKQHRQDHREEKAAAQRQWREEHVEQRARYQSEYYSKNKNRWKTYDHNRRLPEVADCLSPGIVERLFKLQRGRCACCGAPLGTNFHLDHILPLALGGRNVDANTQLLTKLCNLQKHAKHPADFMRARGFLI